MPSKEQYKRAFLSIKGKITPNQLNMLKAHHSAPGYAITMEQLAHAGSYENYKVANLQYGNLGHLLSDALGGFIKNRMSSSPNWTFTLAEGQAPSNGGDFLWVLRPEVAEALQELGLVEESQPLPMAAENNAIVPAKRTVDAWGSALSTPSYVIDKIYNRRQDIHEPFGGQRQGGISTPSGVPYIFIFTGEGGEQYGYKDGWNNDNVYLYTGEGQVGPMQFVRGNKAVRDHLTDGKDLLLFENLGKGKGYRFLGTFACASWENRTGPDAKGNQRQVIVFHLLRQEVIDDMPAPVMPPTHTSIKELRRKAIEASSTPAERDTKETRRRYYERSETVRLYVLARANGKCESCGKDAPFIRPDGSHYLEPHHIRRVSDGGPDDPKWVGGICPNCHREIHYGLNGKAINQRLQDRIIKLENTQRD